MGNFPCDNCPFSCPGCYQDCEDYYGWDYDD